MKKLCVLISFIMSIFLMKAQSTEKAKVQLINNLEIEEEVVYKSLSPCPENGIHLCLALQDTLLVFSDSDAFFEDRKLGTIENWGYIVDSLLFNGYGIDFDGIVDPGLLPLHGAIIGKRNRLLYMREIDFPKTFSVYKAILTAPDLSFAQMRVGMNVRRLFPNVPLNKEYHKIVIIPSSDIEKTSIPSFAVHRKEKYGNLYGAFTCIMLTSHNSVISKIELGVLGHNRAHIFKMYDDIVIGSSLRNRLGYIIDSMRELSNSVQ